jgi:hypothetical protein
LIVVSAEGGLLLLHARDHLGVARLLGQLRELQQVVRAREEGVPDAQLLAQAVRLTQDLLGASLVIPESGSDRGRVELVEPSLLRG